MPSKNNFSQKSELFEEIENLVFWENAGFKTDWSVYSFEILKLYATWRYVEKEIDRLERQQTNRVIQQLLK
ncbi:MAG: hypothetical protein LUM44_17600 [Pyrinomonadaceae bacterium]|nr:hypothetical protein [Pyrinomonadaceae bacterium]